MSRDSMPLNERRKRRTRRLTFAGKILYYTGILLIWHEEEPLFPTRYFSCEKLNLYNPLTYIFLLLALVAGAIQGMVEVFKEFCQNVPVKRFKV